MAKVKTLRSHRNMYGTYSEGDEYEHDRPAADIRFGYVEEVEPTVADLKAVAEDRNIELPKKGSGKKGGVVKADIVEAVEEA